jgi:hypothetical protein
MEYLGIAYDIKMAGGENRWVWTVHTPKPKQGKTVGPRASAVSAAQKAIQAWCYKNPKACVSPPREVAAAD